MEKATIEKILDLSAPQFIEIDGVNYTQQTLRVPSLPSPATLKTGSLDSIVEYACTHIDKEFREGLGKKEFIVINNSKSISFYTSAPNFGSRERIELMTATPRISQKHLFNEYLDPEIFKVWVNAKFASSVDKDNLLNVVSQITFGEQTILSDDGITQEVQVRTGASLKESKQLPTLIGLAPFRTFIEVKQPISSFILRVHNNGLGLFEADGGAWELEAVNNIFDYLKKAFEENGNQDVMILK